MAGKQLCRKGAADPGGQQAVHENSEVPLWQRGPVVFQGALGRDL